MSSYNVQKALEKIASRQLRSSNNMRSLLCKRAADDSKEKEPWWGAPVDAVSNWFAKNPRWGRAALYGGGAFLGTGLLSTLLGSKNPMKWAVPVALAAAAYGHQKPEVDKLGADAYDKVSGWIDTALKDLKSKK